MLPENVFKFLRELKKNNDRGWFHAHKAQYDAANREFGDFIAALLPRIAAFDEELTGTFASDCVFRIFRDIRFSKDKSPYKTNFGAFMAPGGRKSSKPGYYIHVEPDGSFIAGGAYHPDAAQLLKLRQNIVSETREFLGIITSPAFKRAFGELSSHGERLVNVPRGFPPDHEAGEYLKFKNFLVSRPVGPDELNDPAALAAQFELMKPLVVFLRRS